MDDREFSPHIVSLEDKAKRTVSENELAEAIQTISIATEIPVGEILMQIKRMMKERLEIKLYTESLKKSLSFSLEKLAEASKNAASIMASYAEDYDKKLANALENTHFPNLTDLDEMTEWPVSRGYMLYSALFPEEYPTCVTFKIQKSVFSNTETHEESNHIRRRTPRHVPFYFKIFGQSRFVPRKSGRKGHTKFNRNVRPKGTHSHFKFYR